MREIPTAIYEALLLGIVAIIAAAVAYVVAFLSRMKREQDSRAARNEQRDQQRAEVQENVRRLVNSTGVHHDNDHYNTAMLIWNYLHRNAAPVIILSVMVVIAYYRRDNVWRAVAGRYKGKATL
jgi:uncharacterized membrane protein